MLSYPVPLLVWPQVNLTKIIQIYMGSFRPLYENEIDKRAKFHAHLEDHENRLDMVYQASCVVCVCACVLIIF